MTHRDYENTSSIIIKFYPIEIVIENPDSENSSKENLNYFLI